MKNFIGTINITRKYHNWVLIINNNIRSGGYYYPQTSGGGGYYPVFGVDHSMISQDRIYNGGG